jgi:hypothetical protein
MSRRAARANQNESEAKPKRQIKRRPYVYRSNSRVDQLEARHPGLRALVENLLRRRVRQGEIARRVYKRFGTRLSHQSLSTYFRSRIQPEEFAAAEAYRQAHAQARALLEEMKADPALDAAQIAELMLAQQIFKDRAKLGEADILDLYKEQRERRKLELQSQALRLREKQTKAVLKKMSPPRQPPLSGTELAAKIEEIYGIAENPPDISNA